VPSRLVSFTPSGARARPGSVAPLALNCTGSLQVSLTHWIILTLVVCVNHCREEAGINLESPDQKLEVSWFKLLSHGGFSNARTRCSVKYL
jgi:hypothetical protein